MTRKPRPINTFTFDPPAGDSLPAYDVCIWLLRVMDKGDRSVSFVASLLHHLLRYGGVLTDKQADALATIFDRVRQQFEDNRLQLQGYEEPAAPAQIVARRK